MTKETIGTTKMIVKLHGFGIKYDMGGGMTIAASTTEVEDDKTVLVKTKVYSKYW